MKPLNCSLAITLAVLLTGCQSQSQLAKSKSTYLGQIPPGLTPQVFAPNLVSTEEWSDSGKFSPDMKSFYVTRWRVKDNKTQRFAITFKKIGSNWVEMPDPDRQRLPTFSPDGQTMYFRNQYKTLTDTGWSEFKSIGTGFEDIRIMGLSQSTKGTLVIDEWATDGYGSLRLSRLHNGKREAPTPLHKNINTGRWTAHPYIAPDESYLLWDSERESGYGKSDLYISFKQDDGTWGHAINLGETVNTGVSEQGPQVTPDGKYLFFNRSLPKEGGRTQSDLFWVDAKLIADLKSKNSNYSSGNKRSDSKS